MVFIHISFKIVNLTCVKNAGRGYRFEHPWRGGAEEIICEVFDDGAFGGADIARQGINQVGPLVSQDRFWVWELLAVWALGIRPMHPFRSVKFS